MRIDNPAESDASNKSNEALSIFIVLFHEEKEEATSANLLFA